MGILLFSADSSTEIIRDLIMDSSFISSFSTLDIIDIENVVDIYHSAVTQISTTSNIYVDKITQIDNLVFLYSIHSYDFEYLLSTITNRLFNIIGDKNINKSIIIQMDWDGETISILNDGKLDIEILSPLIFNNDVSLDYINTYRTITTFPYEIWGNLISTIRVVQSSVLLKQDTLSDSKLDVAKLDEIRVTI